MDKCEDCGRKPCFCKEADDMVAGLNFLVESLEAVAQAFEDRELNTACNAMMTVDSFAITKLKNKSIDIDADVD